MLFSKLVAAAAFAVSALAQSDSRLAFTQTPAQVMVGSPTTIKWSGGNGGPVSIILKKGNPNDLQTIAVLTGNQQGTSYTWTPSSSLTNGNDYALAIQQGVDTINYSGEFSLTGGSASGTTILAVGGSSTLALSTIAPSSSAVVSGLNATNASSTTTVAATTAVVLVTGASASGTGVSTARNTTFASATLSSTAAATQTSSGASRASSGATTTSSTAGAALSGQAPGVVGAGLFAAALLLL